MLLWSDRCVTSYMYDSIAHKVPCFHEVLHRMKWAPLLGLALTAVVANCALLLTVAVVVAVVVNPELPWGNCAYYIIGNCLLLSL